MSSSQHRDRHNDGFTLVELLIVIVVLGILSGITILAVGQFKDGADSNSCAVDKRRLETAVTAYKASRDANPPSLAAMTTASPAYLDSEDIDGSTLVRHSYTLTYNPSTGEVNDCATALAAGGSGGTPTSAPTSGPTSAPVAPTVTSCTPSAIAKGTGTVVTVAGSDFDAASATVTVGGGDVAVVVTARTATSLSTTMTPTNGAARSPRTVTVSNPSSGLSGQLTSCVTVTN